MVREIHSVVVGIIPAYAGSTSALDNRVEYLQDHPRVRGEHQTFTAPYTMGIGSSPRTRGALPLHHVVHAHDVDHPRVRGEHVPVSKLRTT